MRAGGEGATEVKIVIQHHQLNEHESEQTLEDSEGQGSLPCCSPWSRQGVRQNSVTKQQLLMVEVPLSGLSCHHKYSRYENSLENMLEDYVRNKIAYTVHPILFNIFKFFLKSTEKK